MEGSFLTTTLLHFEHFFSKLAALNAHPALAPAAAPAGTAGLANASHSAFASVRVSAPMRVW